MDNYISNDNNNPINYNGKEAARCERCHNILTPEEYKNQQKNCFECIEEEAEIKKIETNLKTQRETLNTIFDSFSIATIDVVENKKFDISLKNYINKLK